MDFQLNKHIHERARLLILTCLATNNNKAVSFNDLKEALDMTGGNLSVQLRNLEDVEYVTVLKTIEKRKSLTTVSITQKGYEALMSYLDTMEKIIQSVKE